MLFRSLMTQLGLVRSNFVLSFIASSQVYQDMLANTVPKILNQDGIGEPTEILGNTTDPKGWIKFEYQGPLQNSDYRGVVEKNISEIEKEFPGIFQYHLYEDKFLQKRYEISLFETSDTQSPDGTLIHSKAAGDGYPTVGHNATEEFLQGKIRPFALKV